MPIVIGSRSAERAQQTADRAREIVSHGEFAGAQNAHAVQQAGTIVLSVPFASQAETLASVKESFSEGQLLIDATVPLASAVGGRATRTIGVFQGSAAQQCQELLPAGVKVVSALHTVSAHSLSHIDAQMDEDVLICGDSKADKQRAARLLAQIDGLRCVDCGRLEMARVTEAITALLISVNGRYKAHAGIKLAGLPDPAWE